MLAWGSWLLYSGGALALYPPLKGGATTDVGVAPLTHRRCFVTSSSHRRRLVAAPPPVRRRRPLPGRHPGTL